MEYPYYKNLFYGNIFHFTMILNDPEICRRAQPFEAQRCFEQALEMSETPNPVASKRCREWLPSGKRTVCELEHPHFLSLFSREIMVNQLFQSISYYFYGQLQ